MYSVTENLDRHKRRKNTLAAALQSFRIFFDTERDNLPIDRFKYLEPLERLLSVVQAGCGHMKRYMFIGDKLSFGPLSILVIITDVIICFDIPEGQLPPIKIGFFNSLRFHYYIPHLYVNLKNLTTLKYRNNIVNNKRISHTATFYKCTNIPAHV